MYLAERSVLEEESNDPTFTLQSAVRVESIRGKDLVLVGAGVLALTSNNYNFSGLIDGKDISLDFDPKLIPSLPSDIGKNVQIYHHGQIYQFVMENPQLPAKFVLLSEIFYERANKL